MDSLTFKKNKFGSPDEEFACQLLNNQVNREIAVFYSDACKVMNNDLALEATVNIVSHLMRDILTAITEKLLPYDFVSKKKTDRKKDEFGVNREKILLIAHVYKIDKKSNLLKFWLEIKCGKEYQLHKLAHNSNRLGARELPIFQDIWNNFTKLIIFQMKLIDSNLLVTYKQLDGFLSKKDLSEKDLEFIKARMPLNDLTLRYFFERCNHFHNIGMIRKKGFFDHPTKLVEHSDGGFTSPAWPQADFLLRAIKNGVETNTIVDICLSVQTDNPTVKRQIIEIVNYLPIKEAVKFADKLEDYIVTENWYINTDNHLNLIKEFFDSGESKIALNLVDKLLDIKEDSRNNEQENFYHSPITVIRDHEYESIIKAFVKNISAKDNLKIIEILCSKLEKYVDFEFSNNKIQNRDFYLNISRSRIEDDSFGTHNLIISGIRDLSLLSLNSKDNLKKLIEILDKYNLGILYRVKYFLLSKLEKKGNRGLISKALLNASEFKVENIHFSYEYHLLAGKYADLLTDLNKKRLFNMIEKVEGINKERIAHWQINRLSTFISLGGSFKVLYDELLKTVRPIDIESIGFRTEIGTIPTNKILSRDEINNLEIKAFFSFIKGLTDTKRFDLEGFNIEFSEAILLNPDKWSVHAKKFIKLDKLFIRSYFQGYLKVLREGKKSFLWEDILLFAKAVLDAHPHDKDNKKEVNLGYDPDWSWCRRSIIDLISDGISDSNIDIKHRALVWEIIDISLKENDLPFKAKSPKKIKLNNSREDPLFEGINSIRGTAVQAAIVYGSWVKKAVDPNEQLMWRLTKDCKELEKIFDFHLDINNDSSLAIRAILGKNLEHIAWLDIVWLKENIYKFLPKEDKLSPYFLSAFRSYFSYSEPKNPMLEILKEYYLFNIKYLGSYDSYDIRHANDRFVQHLVLFYLRGIDEELLEALYKDGPLEAKAEVISYLGRSFKDWTGVDPIIASKLMNLVEARVKIIDISNDRLTEVKEFEEFSWWFIADAFPIQWRLNILIKLQEIGVDIEGKHLIIDKLYELVKFFPNESICIVGNLIKNDKSGWIDIDELISILKESKKNSMLKKDTLNEAIRTFLSRGYFQVRDLLDE